MAGLTTRWKALSTKGKVGVGVVGLLVVGAIGNAANPPETAPVAVVPSASPAPASVAPSLAPTVDLATAAATPPSATTAAFLTISSPANGTVSSSASVVISGTAPAGATITLDVSLAPDEHTTADIAGTWSMTVQLQEGGNTLVFRVGDDQSTAQSISITYSPTPPPPTPEPTVAGPELPFDPIKLTGKGTKIVRFSIPDGEAAIAVISEKSSSNFVVWTVDATGATTDLLVNVIGNYSGTRLFDDDLGDHSVAFKVESNGSWTITVKPVVLAKVWASGSSTSGKGDMVLQVSPPIDGFAVSHVTYGGKSNFVVWTYSDDGRDLQINEIGSYSGDLLWPSGTILVTVEARGSWTISAPS